MKNLIVLFISVFAAFPSQAQTKLDPKDEITAEIRDLAIEALESTRGLVVENDQLIDHMKRELPKIKAFLTDEPLAAQARVGSQESLAMNFPSLGLILFSKKRWPTIESRDVRKAIALHEVASLLKLESTGVYIFSNVFLALKGLTVVDLQNALNGVSKSADEVSCTWAADRMHFFFEVWTHSLEECKNRYTVDRITGVKERRLRDVISLVEAKCTDQKVLSTSNKLTTIIGTMKAAFPADCSR